MEWLRRGEEGAGGHWIGGRIPQMAGGAVSTGMEYTSVEQARENDRNVGTVVRSPGFK